MRGVGTQVDHPDIQSGFRTHLFIDELAAVGREGLRILRGLTFGERLNASAAIDADPGDSPSAPERDVVASGRPDRRFLKAGGEGEAGALFPVLLLGPALRGCPPRCPAG